MHIDPGASAHPTDKGAELYRLGLQAQVWRPAAEDFLADLGIAPGARAVDLGCGSIGVLRTLSRAVGDTGTVVGVESSPVRLAAARAYVAKANLRNTSIAEGTPLATDLPSGQFDLVHCRFLFAPFGFPEALLTEMLRLLRPGGCIAIQEPDGSCWNISPPHAAWSSLKSAIIGAFRLAGGNFNAGLQTFSMLRAAGMQDVCQRNTVMACYDQHPYKHLPLQFAGWLRSKILEGGLMSEGRLEACMADVGILAKDPGSVMTTFIVTQVAARKP
jgi:ubiquinone/menaquinone biosynthesis C-methylase UbiE